MRSKSKILGASITASIVFTLAVLFADGRAEAASTVCVPTSVTFQQTAGSPGEALVIYCNPTTFYILFVSGQTPAPPAACSADIGIVQSLQTVAIAARMTGNSVQISYTDTMCNGSTLHVITGVFM